MLCRRLFIGDISMHIYIHIFKSDEISRGNYDLLLDRTLTWRIKVLNFAEMFVLGYLLRKNMASREIQTEKLAGVIKRERKEEKYIKHLQLFTR